MIKKLLLFLLITTCLLVINSQPTPTPTMSYNATYALISDFIIQSPFEHKWIEMFNDPVTSKIRQTFMNSLGTSNKTQFQLSVGYPISILAVSAINFTCAIVKEYVTHTYSSYILDSAGQTITLFNNMSYLTYLSQIDPSLANITITQNCEALKINNKIYHYTSGSSQYVQDTLPFTLTSSVLSDYQLAMLIDNGQIYNYNATTKVYQLQRTDIISTFAQFIQSDVHQERVIITSGSMVQNKIVFKISINQFKNGSLINIIEINDQTYYQPSFMHDRTLSRIIYTVISSSGVPKIKGLFVNYRMSTVTIMTIPSVFYTIVQQPYVLITQNYLYVRQISSSTGTLRQFIMQFLGNQILTISQRNLTQNELSGFKKVVIQQRDTQISVFLQIETQPLFYSISQMIYDKISSQPTIPNAPDPNLFSFTYPVGVNLKRSSTYPNWMYFSYDGTTTTTITSQVLAIGQTDNKITISGTQTGNWAILGETDLTLNCAVAFESTNVKILYTNLNTGLLEQKSDISTILTAESVTDPTQNAFDVSDQCMFLKIDTSIYYYNGTEYIKTNINDNQNAPTNFLNAVFDETFKIAVVNGTVYQYTVSTNLYTPVYTPDQTQSILTNQKVFLNQDKLIILSSSTNSASPPESQYRLHCLRYNGTNWLNIDVALEGTSIYGPPGIQISPNFQIFGIGGTNLDDTPFIYGRYVQYQNSQVISITIPSEMMYNNQIPYIRLSDNYLYYRRLPSVSTPIPQNHEAFYQIDKSNGLLKFINKRNLTADEQLIWKNTFVKQINSSMVVFYETQDANTVKLTQRLIGNANGGGAPTANIVESDTGVLLIGNKTYMCSVGCSSCLTANSCEECAEGFALDSVSLSCKRCKGSCKACAPSDASTCTSCFPGTFLSVDSCLPCGSPCVECDILANNCTACKPGMILNTGACSACPLSNCVNCQDANTCLKCRPGFSITSSNECVQCMSSCSKCNPTNISICQTCRDGFELNTTSTKCIKCPDNCKVCVNQVCSECNNNFRVTSSGKCAKKCEFPCMSCSDTNPSSCLSCSGQYVLSSNRCIPNSNCNATAACQKCAVGYILFLGVCYPCQAGNTCKQCDSVDPTLCLSCMKGYYLDSASICVACPVQCSGCETAQSCTSCKDGYTLPADSTTSQCLACESPCQTCISSTTNCLTCVSGYKLQGWKCRSKINIEWVFELDIVFTSIDTTQILAILDAIATLLGIPIDSITLMDAYSGSTVLSGSSDASTAADVSAGLTSLSTASAGTTLGGAQIVSSTFTGNDGSTISTEQSSNTLTIVLAVVLPIIVISAIIIAIILYKKGLIFAKSTAISQQVQFQTLDNINSMNLKELKLANQQLPSIPNTQSISNTLSFGIN